MNPGPHAYLASTLPTELLCTFVFYKAQPLSQEEEPYLSLPRLEPLAYSCQPAALCSVAFLPQTPGVLSILPERPCKLGLVGSCETKLPS